MFWILSYRDFAVHEVIIEAANEERAEILGKKWCVERTTRPGTNTDRPATFVSVRPMVVAKDVWEPEGIPIP
jgi:hypothetical protein